MLCVRDIQHCRSVITIILYVLWPQSSSTKSQNDQSNKCNAAFMFWRENIYSKAGKLKNVCWHYSIDSVLFCCLVFVYHVMYRFASKYSAGIIP